MAQSKFEYVRNFEQDDKVGSFFLFLNIVFKKVIDEHAKMDNNILAALVTLYFFFIYRTGTLYS